jgi:hypothetical protein
MIFLCSVDENEPYLRRRMMKKGLACSVAKSDFCGEIQISDVRISMTYRFPNSRKTTLRQNHHEAHEMLTGSRCTPGETCAHDTDASTRAATPQCEVKRHRAVDHSNDCMAVPLMALLPHTLRVQLRGRGHALRARQGLEQTGWLRPVGHQEMCSLGCPSQCLRAVPGGCNAVRWGRREVEALLWE